MRKLQWQWLMTAMALLAGILATSSTAFLWADNTGNGFDSAYHNGVAAYRAGHLGEALDAFGQAQSLVPDNANVRYYEAVIYDRLNQPGKAVPQYRFVVDHGAEKQVLAYAKTRLETLSSENTLAVSTEPAQANLAIMAHVPLKNYKNALMVDATLINEKTGQRVTGTFIIDTGATYTSISRDMADQLGLTQETGDSVYITTANGRISVPKVHVDHLNVNGLVADNVEATVIDVRKGSSFSGLLGLNFLKRFKLTIDPQAMELTFQPAQ